MKKKQIKFTKLFTLLLTMAMYIGMCIQVEAAETLSFTEEELNLPNDGNTYWFLYETDDAEIPYRLVTSPVKLTGKHNLFYDEPAYIVKRLNQEYSKIKMYYTTPGIFSWTQWTEDTGVTIKAEYATQSNFDLIYNGCTVGDSCSQYHPANIGDNFFPPCFTVSEDKSVNVKVDYDKTSSWKAILPKTVIMDTETNSGKYAIQIFGNISPAEAIIIKPVSNIIDFTSGNSPTKLSGDIKQNITLIRGDNLSKTKEAPSKILGTVSVTETDVVRAGNWHSIASFEIKLQKCVAGFYDNTGALILKWADSGINSSVALTNSTYKTANNTVYKKIEELKANGKYITKLVLPEDMTEIPAYFLADINIAEVYIPDSVTEIKDYAFMNSDFSNIYIPKTVTAIAEHSFIGINHIIYQGSAVDDGTHFGATSIN